MIDVSPFDVKIEFPFNVVMSGILPFIPRAWQELLDNDLMAPDTLPIMLHQNVIVAKIDGNIAGFICYTRQVAHGFTWVDMSYVLPEYRRKGVYSKLFNALVASERKHPQPVRSITSGISIKNTAQIEASLRLGRTSKYAQYDYHL